jgi:hypothetical protein
MAGVSRAVLCRNLTIVEGRANVHHNPVEPRVPAERQPGPGGRTGQARVHQSRGKPVHVLMSIEEYRRITGKGKKIADLLALPGSEDIELEIPKLGELPAGDLC